MHNYNSCKKKSIRDRVLSLILVLSIMTGMFAGLSFGGTSDAHADEDSVTYIIDSTSEITWYKNKGPFGRIIYTKKHYTSGSGIKYYTRKFVLSMSEAGMNDNLLALPNSVVLNVSNDGRSYDINEIDTDQPFYWYDSEPDFKGYITTTYSIDGSYFYKLMGGKAGKIYIHHVFGVAGGSNSDSWHQQYGVFNNTDYARYSDLMKIGWNDTAKTHASQEGCLNVLVPFERNVKFVVNYYDALDKTPIRSIVSYENFYEDYKTSDELRTINVNIPAEPVYDAAGREYEIYKSSSLPFNFKWAKVEDGLLDAYLSNPKNSATDPANVIPDAYNSSYDTLPVSSVGTQYTVKSKEVLDGANKIPNGVLSKNVTASFALENVSGYTWEIVLSIPVRLKSKTTDVGIHFFDSKTKTELGSYRELVKNATMDSTYTVSNLTELLTSSGLDQYEIDTSCGLEFTSAGSSEEIKTSYASALDSKTGKGTLTAAKYVTAKLTNDSTTVAWIPVKAKPEEPKAIPVYVRYVTSDGSTISDLGKKGAILL